MAIKTFRPTTPTRRYQSTVSREEITSERPMKALVEPRRRTGGRDSQGHIAVRHHGGGHKRQFRVIDFLRNKHGIPAKVASIEYDPNRSARIALLHYVDGEKRYILQPVGTTIHNIELRPGKGAQMARSAGAAAQLVSKEAGLALLKLPSGEIRRASVEGMATIGQVGNVDHENITIGKAGRSRWLGKRPSV